MKEALLIAIPFFLALVLIFGWLVAVRIVKWTITVAIALGAMAVMSKTHEPRSK